MPGDPEATVFVGNLDDVVDERALYEIMIQAGPLVELYIPRDKETKRHKGYGFAEYTTQANAQYAIQLFSGLVCIHNKSLRFAISGQDKSSPKPVRAKPTSLNPHVAHAQKTSGRSLAPSSSGCGYSPASHSSATKKNDTPMKSGRFIRSHRSIAEEAQRWNSHLTAMGQMGVRSSVSGSAYSYASPSY